MAQSGVGGPAPEKLHPFFSRDAARELSIPPAASSPSNPGAHPTDDDAIPNSGDDTSRRKRRKTESPSAQEGSGLKKARQKGRNGALGSPLASNGIMSHLIKANPSPLDSKSSTTSDHASKPEEVPLERRADEPARPSKPGDTATPDQPRTPVLQPQKAAKVLKFNPRTGTLGSPPSAKNKQSPTRMVCIRYGQDAATRQAIGAKITQILGGELQIPVTPTRKRGNRSAASQGSAATKSSEATVVHPFFASKTRPPDAEPSEPNLATKSHMPKSSVFMSTPVSPQKSRNPFVSGAVKAIPFGAKSIGTKVPGAMLPLWPAAGMSHIRGEIPSCGTDELSILPEEIDKKFKEQVTAIAPHESLLTHLINNVDPESIRKSIPADPDSFTPAPAELRIPKRRFESGRKLRRRIKSQLTPLTSAALASIDDSSQDELSSTPSCRAHPAISSLYQSLATDLSAFDKSTCENLSWTQKYAPRTAAQVLQTGKECFLLKQWLEALKVQAVEGGVDLTNEKGKAKSDANKKKKRKTKLEGFVVDSDEGSELDELSDIEGDDAAGPSKRSLVRSGLVSAGTKGPGKLRNTIVISGPHGCGKSAAVYAAAKELGFEVFELNPSSRRSGKDVSEKVGDMTRNHLVQQHQAQHPNGDNDQSTKSAKQGMMTSFFKSKVNKDGNQQSNSKAKEKPDKSTKESVPRSQKQSLILLEEADVLYEEDKQFWTTITAMMAQSKRPFVVTCNDENLIPLQSLSLHGIFRFTPPPESLAVDLCLLIAASEGHALRRAAVDSLFRSRGNDLRATITELNYWCQIGIGDRKGGFDWFYPRWPKGSDIDETGDVVRVISDGTYLHGMGWISRDLIVTTPDPLEMEQEVLHQAWDSWRMDMGDWYDSNDVADEVTGVTASPSDRREAFANLTAYEAFCDAMSAADVCSRGTFGTKMEELVDPTLPEMTSRGRDDFIVGRALLEADSPALTTSGIATTAITLRSFARDVLSRSATWDSINRNDSALAAVDERRAIKALDSSFQFSRRQLTRYDVALAFDPIAVAPKAQPSPHLDPSVFDRPMKPIILDVAPWVRGIIAFEFQLYQERLKLSNLLSEGGTRKRMRTTRSAYSALEGGERRTTRKERYFGDCLVTGVVMRTGAASFRRSFANISEEGHDDGTPNGVQYDDSDSS
ncbi:hypothetical protein HIM_08549 [Hirsutella minnesotensis 3608]|uniref:AAA+ ATPase domain-containing protein n=1 Tax=Hirsutella minnesotensis 3608 TaxID=1043627 RepID=A0A0F8A3M6_9HYPO|nr:hypothetical protein HIM_08549 [Hirsutella minnesotensis 3608]